MSMIWKMLNELKDSFIEKFDRTGYRVEEPGLKRFNQTGWTNLVWCGEDYRRAHVSVIDATESKKLWMMHVCVHPHADNASPIYGFDVVAGKNKCTGVFLDYSPAIKEDLPIYSFLKEAAKENEWKRERELPDWGKEIFSDHMIAIGNVSEDETKNISEIAQKSLYFYLNNIILYEVKENESLFDEIEASHKRYAINQKKNIHTPKVLVSLGLNETDVKDFIESCLFPNQ